MAGYRIVGLQSPFEVGRNLQRFARVATRLNDKYAAYGILGESTGIVRPGIRRPQFPPVLASTTDSRERQHSPPILAELSSQSEATAPCSARFGLVRQ